MFTVLWSVKGGVGVTTVAVGLASSLAGLDARARRRTATSDVLLVDLAGDIPAACGLAEPPLGLTDWLASTQPDHAGLQRLEVEVSPTVALLPRGAAARFDATHASSLVDILALDHREVIVDLGHWPAPVTAEDCGDDPTDVVRAALVGGCDRSLLVTRCCYLGLRRAVHAKDLISGAVVLREPGRAMDTRDVEEVLEAPVVAEVEADPSVARLVDAGLLVHRPDRNLCRAMRRAA